MKFARLLCAMALVLVGSFIHADAKMMEPLGESYFMPGYDILAPKDGGRNIFKNIADTCYKSREGGITTDSRSTFSNIDTFYSKLSTDSGLDANLKGAYTMGATVNVKTASKSEGKTDVRGTSINVLSISNITYLSDDCFKNESAELIDELVAQLDYLPLDITRPETANSWAHYKAFLTNYGSHFVTATSYGSLLRWWTFSEQKEGYTERMVNVKSCVDFTGVTEAGKVNVSACSDVTSEEMRNYSSLTTSKNLEIQGGSDETRSRLQSNRSDELIAELMKEGKTHPQPIVYRYVAIWDILMMKFIYNPDRFAKAMNMRQYYEGFLDFGCTVIDEGGMNLRIFRKSRFHEPSAPDYECWLERDGCHTNADCHLYGAFSFCYGKSCVDHIDPPLGKKATESRIRTRREEGHSDGINKSCYLSVPTKCDTSWSNSKAIWEGQHSYRSMMMALNIKKPRAPDELEVDPNAVYLEPSKYRFSIKEHAGKEEQNEIAKEEL